MRQSSRPSSRNARTSSAGERPASASASGLASLCTPVRRAEQRVQAEMRADVNEERAFAQLGEEDLACVRVEPPGGDVSEEAAVAEEAAELEPLGLSSQWRAAAAYEEHVDAVAYGTQK